MLDHPFLPAGYNADSNNDDEVDGAGTNWPIWPVLFDSFIPLNVFILTSDMLAVFDGCPDYSVSWVDNLVTLPCEDSELVLADIWPGMVVTRVINSTTIAREDNVLVATDRWDDYVIPSVVRIGG